MQDRPTCPNQAESILSHKICQPHNGETKMEMNFHNVTNLIILTENNHYTCKCASKDASESEDPENQSGRLLARIANLLTIIQICVGWTSYL